MVYIPECSTKAYSTALIIISLTPLFCHSRSNKCSSSFSVMWCCRPAGFTVGITDSWSLRFNASSLRKKDLQEGEQQSYFSYFNQSFHRFFGVHREQNSLLDSWREVLFTVAVCCFVVLYLTPGVSANTLLESWQRCLSQCRLQRRLINNLTVTSTI